MPAKWAGFLFYKNKRKVYSLMKLLTMIKICLKIQGLNPGELEEIHALAEKHGFQSPVSTVFQKEFEDFFKGIHHIVLNEDRTVGFVKGPDDMPISIEETARFIKSFGKVPA